MYRGILREDLSEWFEIDTDSPYMLFVAAVKKDKRYTMTNDESISEKDVLFSESPRAVVDKESLNYVWGSTIDLSGDKFSASLTVDNPCAKMSCGCGTSFNFDPKFFSSLFLQLNFPE